MIAVKRREPYHKHFLKPPKAQVVKSEEKVATPAPEKPAEHEVVSFKK